MALGAGLLLPLHWIVLTPPLDSGLWTPVLGRVSGLSASSITVIDENEPEGHRDTDVKKSLMENASVTVALEKKLNIVANWPIAIIPIIITAGSLPLIVSSGAEM